MYAHWQRLQANVVYDKNASDAKGSHANTTGWQYSDVTLYAIWLPYHENFVETGGVSLPVLIVGGVVLLAAGVASTIVLTRRMRGEQ